MASKQQALAEGRQSLRDRCTTRADLGPLCVAPLSYPLRAATRGTLAARRRTLPPWPTKPPLFAARPSEARPPARSPGRPWQAHDRVRGRVPRPRLGRAGRERGWWKRPLGTWCAGARAGSARAVPVGPSTPQHGGIPGRRCPSERLHTCPAVAARPNEAGSRTPSQVGLRAEAR